MLHGMAKKNVKILQTHILPSLSHFPFSLPIPYFVPSSSLLYAKTSASKEDSMRSAVLAQPAAWKSRQ